MKIHLILFAIAAVFGALSLVSEPVTPAAIPNTAGLEDPLPQAPVPLEDDRPEFFSPREESTKFVYNLPFYPPGQTPPGELEYDPIPFENLLPKDSQAESIQQIATPTGMRP